VARLSGSTAQFTEYLFTAADGRLCAYGTAGEAVAGYPVAGPGAAGGTPALGHVGADLALDLVTVGAFARLVSVDPDGSDPTTEVVSTVVVFADVATGAVWPMAGGSPWRNGDWAADTWSSPPGAGEGTGIVVGSHLCFPSPLVEGPLGVRASARAPGRARVLIYNLEGELVIASAWRAVPAREPFTVEVDLGGAASGMYLCRLVVESDLGARDESVVAFAVAR
jgi:hypothetical protein